MHAMKQAGPCLRGHVQPARQTHMYTGGNGDPPDNAAIWTKAAVQVVTALVVTYVAMAAEWKYQAIDHFSFWVRDMKTFVWYLLFIVTIGGSRWGLVRLLGATTDEQCHECYHSWRFSWRCPAEALVSRLCVELLVLFCPRDDPKSGIILEYCDKPRRACR